MNEGQNDKSNPHPKRNLSLEEKRNYCMAWEESEMNQITFCKANGISKSALYQWTKNFKKEQNRLGFSALVLDEPPSIKQADMIQLSLCFSNQIQLSMALPTYRLVSFIQELGDATAVIR